MAGMTRLELAASCVTGRRSNRTELHPHEPQYSITSWVVKVKRASKTADLRNEVWPYGVECSRTVVRKRTIGAIARLNRWQFAFDRPTKTDLYGEASLIRPLESKQVGFQPLRRTWYKRFAALVALLLTIPTSAFSQKQPKPGEEDAEVKLGRENAAENDKTVRLVSDAKLLERVNRIGQDIAVAANTTVVPATWGSPELKKFSYTFKIVDDKDPNAYSLPGGFIYVNKGILDYCKSDDELAGVLAHECAHAAHHHMMKLIREQNKMQPYLLAALLAAAFAGRSSENANALAVGAQLYAVAKLNSYGIEAEKDADQAGVRYLQKTKYNPVGLLTFMERLARDEARGPDRILGIYRTHPPSPERAKALLAQLESMHIAVNRRTTDPTLGAKLTMKSMNGVPVAEVAVNKTVIACLTSIGGLTADERAKKLASDFDSLMDQDVQMYEVKLTADKAGIQARSHVLIAFSETDARAVKSTTEAAAQSALEAIRNVIWQAQFNRIPVNSSPAR